MTKKEGSKPAASPLTLLQEDNAWRSRIKREDKPDGFCSAIADSTDIGFRTLGGSSSISRKKKSSSRRKTGRSSHRDPDDPIYTMIEEKLSKLESSIMTERGDRIRAEEELKSLKVKMTARRGNGNGKMTTRSGTSSSSTSSTKSMMSFKDFKACYGTHHELRNQWRVYKQDPQSFAPTRSLVKAQRNAGSLPQINRQRIKMKKGEYVMINGTKRPIPTVGGSQGKAGVPPGLKSFGAAKSLPRLDNAKYFDKMFAVPKQGSQFGGS